MKKRVVLILLMAVLLIPAGLFALLNSEAGSRWLVRQILSALPAQASVQQISGSLLKQISLKQFHYQTVTETLDVARINLAWQPGQLLAGRLQIIDLSAEGIYVDIKPSETTEESTPFDWNADVPVPLQVTLENLAIVDLHYQSGDSQMELQHLKLSAFTEQNRLKLSALRLAAQPVEIQADGVVTLGKQFPFTLRTHWQVDSAEYGSWQADTDFNGDINRIKLSSRQTSPFKLELQGDVAELQAPPRFNLRGDWQQLAWPLTGSQPQFVSEQGYFEIKGAADAYQITLAGPLTQDYLPQAELHFAGHGSTEAIFIEDLQIASGAGSFQLNGQAAWADATTFDINAKGQDFNPAIFVAELPGKLTFNARINGELKDDSQKIHADIGKLTGRLRGQPVEAQGRLAMLDDSFDVDGLILKSGRNRIDADGQLGPSDSDLILDIDTPALAGLWPGLAGKLKGHGRIQGDWQNPAVRFKAQGTGLKFEKNSIAKLSADIAYQTGTDKASNVSVKLSQVKTAGQSIDMLLLEGSGKPQQHSLSLDMQSPILSLAGALSGGMTDKHWQGELLNLKLQHPEAGTWQLRAPATIQALMKDDDVDASLSQTCLAQRSASLCIAGDYRANGDFTAKLNATSLSTDLLQTYLPDTLQINGIVDADADIEQHKGLMAGNYRIGMPAKTKVLYQDADITQALELGPLTIAGRLRDKLLTTDADLTLSGNDTLRAQGQLDLGPSQTLSGRINASIQDFTLVDALVPQISDVQGKLEADLNVNGTLSAPLASGTLRLTQAATNVKNLGISITDTNLEIATLNEAGGKLKLSGSAKSGNGMLTLAGIADLKGNADIDIAGTDFEVAKLPEAEVDISPNLHIAYSESGGKVSGLLQIPKAIITLAELPKNAVAVSEDEVILGEEKPQQKPPPEPGLDADIDIELGKRVSFSGFGLKTNLAGRLKVAKTGQQTRLHGTIDMLKGIYKSYGQDLTLRKGRFLFSGPIAAPWLDVEASRLSKSGDVTAVLSVSGPLKSPKTRIYSEPSLPESDALAYLITGSPLSQVGKGDSNLVASAALSYGVGQLSWVKDKLGVDEFEIKQGKTLQDTLLAMGQYLTEDFYVGTKLGIFNQQAVLVLKQKLSKSFSVETQSGTSQRIKLNYEVDTD